MHRLKFKVLNAMIAEHLRDFEKFSAQKIQKRCFFPMLRFVIRCINNPFHVLFISLVRLHLLRDNTGKDVRDICT